MEPPAPEPPAPPAWTYDPARDLDQTVLERLRRVPREPDMLVYALRLGAAALIRGWLGVYHRLRIQGREHLPASGPFVLVANHASHLDTLCLLTALRVRDLHRAFPAAARDYFFVTVPRLMLSAVIVNALPFDRRRDPRGSLALCRRLLEQGAILVLFPEGTRSATGEVGEFKPGIGLVMAGTDFPVIPCYLDGAHTAWPKGAWLPRPRRLRLVIGEPRRFADCTPGREAAGRIARDLRGAVLELRR